MQLLPVYLLVAAVSATNHRVKCRTNRGRQAAGTTPEVGQTQSMTPGGAGKTHIVKVGSGGLKYDIPNLQIARGDTVMWTFGGAPHTVTESVGASCDKKQGGFDSGKLTGTQTFSQTFTKEGTINYMCSVGTHCTAGMKATITVGAGAATGGAGNAEAPVAGGVQHFIKVGDGGLKYNVTTMKIAKGDTVNWVFAGAAHTVTQSQGDSCDKKQGGFDSGKLLAPQTFSKTFTKDETINYICSVGSHCSAGMKAVIIVGTGGGQAGGAPTEGAKLGNQHFIQVGAGGLKYNVTNLEIQKGDTVNWVFAGKDHTVTEADGETCNVKQGGFDSGKLLAPQTFSKTFTEDATIHYICAVGNHCTQGMKAMIKVGNGGVSTPGAEAPKDGATELPKGGGIEIGPDGATELPKAGAATEGSSPTQHFIEVASGGLSYNSTALNIKVGDTVNWVFAGADHTVTESEGDSCDVKAGGFDSGKLKAPQTFSQTFTQEGTVNYMCSVGNHCAQGMKASIIVGAAGSDQTSEAKKEMSTGLAALLALLSMPFFF